MSLTYNQSRFSQNLLTKYKKCPPSFTIDLYDDHWTLNKGPTKFLYTQPVSCLLDEVRAMRIPVDFIEIFDMAHVPYYEGCMIVESMDHRKPRSHGQQSTSKEPECVRVVLQPTAESLYADLCLLNAKHGGTWTDQEAIEIEAKILNATCPPLCLDPDINLTRVVNTVIRASTPADSVILKRKQVHEPEEDENDKAKRAKLWSQYMHPQNGKPPSQTRKRSMFDVLNEVAQKDEKGVYTLKSKPKNVATPYHPPQPPPPQNTNNNHNHNHNLAPPPNPNPNPNLNPNINININTAPPSMPPAVPQEDQKPKPKVKLVTTAKNTDSAGMPPPPLPMIKGKKNPMAGISAPAPLPTPSPAPGPEQRKMASATPGVTRPPVEAAAVPAKSPHPPPQFVPQPQPSSASPRPALPNAAAAPIANSKKRGGVLKKTEDQVAQPPAHLQPQQPHPSEAQANNWQPSSAQYLSQPPQKKQPTQPLPQAQPYHPHTPAPGFANATGYAQNAGYKNAAGMVQHPNMNPNRASPMTHNQPLLSRDPLPPHSQSPRPPPQQAPQASAGAQHPMTHPAHQFNMHAQQNRFNSAMQAQAGHHQQPMPQHAMAQQQHQQHHAQAANAARNVPGQHDPSQGMMHPQMPYNPMFPYQVHLQGMMNGVRMPNMPGAQGAGGQYMPASAWRVPAQAGRGGGPMTTLPIQYQQQQQQMMAAAMNRAQQQAAQAQQAQGQGR